MQSLNLRIMPIRIMSTPKQSTDYNELSSYLELNADYLESMSVFDQAWEQYVQIEEGLLLGDQE